MSELVIRSKLYKGIRRHGGEFSRTGGPGSTGYTAVRTGRGNHIAVPTDRYRAHRDYYDALGSNPGGVIGSTLNKSLGKRYRMKTRGKKKTLRGRRRKYIPRTIQPRTKLIKVKLVHSQTDTPSTSPSVQLVSMNALCDPFVGDLTPDRQPMGFDQWKTLYERAVVVGSKITVRVHNAGAQEPLMVGITPGSEILGTTNLGSFEHYMEMPGTKAKLISQDVDHCIMSHKVSLRKHFAIKNFKDNRAVLSTSLNTEALPTRQAFWHIWAQPHDQTTATACDRVFTIEYLYNIGVITQSDFVDIPYVISSVPDYQASAIAVVGFTLVINDLSGSIQSLIASIQAVSSGTLDWAEIFTLIGEVLKFTVLVIASVKLLRRIVYLLIQKIKYHKGIKTRTIFEKGCQYLGLTFQSTIIPDYEYILPRKYVVPVNPQNLYNYEVLGAFNANEFPQYGFPDGTFADFIIKQKERFNGKVTFDGSILNFERKDYYNGTPSLTLPNIINIKVWHWYIFHCFFNVN